MFLVTLKPELFEEKYSKPYREWVTVFLVTVQFSNVTAPQAPAQTAASSQILSHAGGRYRRRHRRRDTDAVQKTGRGILEMFHQTHQSMLY
jgi:hypothetical protein